MEREKRRVAFLNQQLEQQRQLGKNQAEIEALQNQIKEQNDKLAAMQATLNGKSNDGTVANSNVNSLPPADKDKELVGAAPAQAQPWWKPW